MKRDNPKADDASVLLERDIEYDYLIQVMDTVRSAYVPAETDPSNPVGAEPAMPMTEGTTAKPRLKKMPLFANIAIGEAP